MLMAWLGDAMGVEEARVKRDLMLLECVGGAMIAMLVTRYCAATYCAVGYILHGFGAMVTDLGSSLCMGKFPCDRKAFRAQRHRVRGSLRRIPTWIVIIILLGVVSEATAWSVRDESDAGRSDRARMDVGYAQRGKLAFRTTWDRLAAFWWERVVQDDDDEVFRTPEPQPWQYGEYRVMQCENMKCRFFALQDQALSLLYEAVLDPRQMFSTLANAVDYVRFNGIPYWPQLLGFGILWGLLNAFSAVWIHFEELIKGIYRLGRAFFQAPIFKLMGRWMKTLKDLCKEGSDSEKGEEKGEKKEKEGGIERTVRKGRR